MNVSFNSSINEFQSSGVLAPSILRNRFWSM